MTHAEIRDAATDTHKHCSRCGEFKPLNEFPKQARGFKGRAANCRRCWSTYISAWNRTTNAKETRGEYLRREHVRKYVRQVYVKRHYGEEAMPLEERRLAGDPCEGCKGHDRIGIDHCHSTGKPRGLLCRTCNLAVSYAGDDPQRLRALADYLERTTP